MAENVLIIMLGVLFVGVGLLHLFAKDAVWELNDMFYRWEGIDAEPTDRWYAQQTIYGILLLLVGSFVIYYGIQYQGPLDRLPAFPSELHRLAATSTPFK